MDPNEWGPDTWKFLHIVSIKSQASQAVLHDFFYNLKFILPCSTCRRNYDTHFNAIEFPTHKKEIAGWLIKIHNRVNQSIQQRHEDEALMLDMWKTKARTIRRSSDMGIWTFVKCSVDTHPGKYKISSQQEKSLHMFWKFLPELLPNTLEDYSEICAYVEERRIMDIVSLKGAYHNEVQKLFDRFHLMYRSIKDCERANYCVRR